MPTSKRTKSTKKSTAKKSPRAAKKKVAAPKRRARKSPPGKPGPVNEWMELRRSPIHGLGGFARKDIPKGTRIIEYTGEIISNAMNGASETAIDRILGISQHTVHTHLERLHRKLNVTSRPQLIARIFATYVDVVHDVPGIRLPPSPPSDN